MMTTAEKLCDTIKDFPEPLMAELIDFAQFLKGKLQSEKIEGMTDDMLTALKGGLEGSQTYAGDPVEIQEKLRNEWD